MCEHQTSSDRMSHVTLKNWEIVKIGKLGSLNRIFHHQTLPLLSFLKENFKLAVIEMLPNNILCVIMSYISERFWKI